MARWVFHLTALLAMTVAACSPSGDDAAPGEKEAVGGDRLDWEIQLDPGLGSLTKTPVVVQIDGVDYGPFTERQTLTVSGHFDPPEVSVRALFACGWKSVPISVFTEDADRRKRFMVAGLPARLSVEPFSSRELRGSDLALVMYTLYVDNRDGEASGLNLGLGSQAVEADALVSLKVLAPDCEDGAELSLGGRSMGRLPVAAYPGSADQNAQLRHFLVDASGTRCYSYEERVYAGGVWGSPGYEVSGPRPPSLLGPGSLHELADGYVQFWFEPFPESVKSLADISTRHRVVDAECSE